MNRRPLSNPPQVSGFECALAKGKGGEPEPGEGWGQGGAHRPHPTSDGAHSPFSRLRGPHAVETWDEGRAPTEMWSVCPAAEYRGRGNARSNRCPSSPPLGAAWDTLAHGTAQQSVPRPGFELGTSRSGVTCCDR